ncbi:MAG: hypothetical protein AAB574_03110 [Patescibacteria group bacterium]
MIGILGNILNPTKYQSIQGEGLFVFLSNLFKFAGVIAGIIFIVQLITAGFDYIASSGDPKKFLNAGNKILQSVLGLVVVASAFLLAGLVSRLTGINILNPTIYGPK